jgi:CubicO group peptidase (beta-lactamase class C family)
VLWAAAFGVKKVWSAEPVTTETMFNVQSISKLYTATAAMLAVQDGLVELDVPITTYLPEFTVWSKFEAHPERRITLRHLLSHTAGFTHEAPVGNNYLVVPSAASTPGRWAECEAEYAIEAQGVKIRRVRLYTEGARLLYEESPGARGLWLEEHQPGIFYSSTGEVLDLTHDPPTYANIQLHRSPEHK